MIWIQKMKKIILVFLFFFMCGHSCRAEQSMLVQAGERQFIGNPETLSILRNISVGEHEIVISRWRAEKGINELMPILTSQIPVDTIAWSEGLVLHMQWDSSEFSHVLKLMPLSDKQVLFHLSSVRSQPESSAIPGSKNLSLKSFKHLQSDYPSLKNMLTDPELDFEVIMDIRDLTEQAEAVNLIYVSKRPIFQVDEKLRSMLAKRHWAVTKDPIPSISLRSARSFEAIRPSALLRIDLIEYMGRTFLHLNLSKGTAS
jgi:hypothetical protein